MLRRRTAVNGSTYSFQHDQMSLKPLVIKPVLTAPSARTLWVQTPHAEEPTAAQIRAGLAAAGIFVYLMAFQADLSEACRTFDLIILDGSAQVLEQLATIVAQIRKFSHAPVVILTDQPVAPWSLTLLPAGADLVLSFDTSVKVVVMRCIALLRRWLNT